MDAFLPEALPLWAFFAIMLVSFIGSAITAALSIGGGLLLIGTMSALLPPAAVIPVHAVVMVGSNAGRSGLLLPHVEWRIIGWFAAGALVGGLIGAQVVFGLPPQILRLAIAAFILFTQWGPKVSLPLGAPFYALAGGLSMFLTLFVGASGPFITAILAKIPQFSRLALIATAGACMTLQHGGKVLIFGISGFDYGAWLGLMAAALVAGFAGTFMGTRFLKRIDEALFRKALKWLLTALAVWLIFLAVSD
ncbi:sulfite exporter TauE/SafE family protein [Parvularcula sp. ZS-1/3]|uniref:Probable membrane transporter protein n=1 Tax=Parvularcula mediterranea TaxID=2732508 RepID=A0A7Y3RKS8_9PROT|nr:sulfite exporter TauE/SafE family protein [Parvularcula mediterranea]NNU15898.1 sulfite exporter TauE/SafE family protein [Parvularcula mediterranea]